MNCMNKRCQKQKADLTDFSFPGKNALFLRHVNGLDDPRLPSLDIAFSPDAAYTLGISQQVYAYVQYAKSYVCSANIIAQSSHCETGDLILKAPTLVSMAPPVMFCCRHAVELIIKAWLQYKDISLDSSHSLHQLWKLTQIKNQEMTKYVNFLNQYDSDGTQWRYPYSKNNKKQVHPDAAWVKTRFFVETTEKFVDAIIAIMAEESNKKCDKYRVE